MTKSDHEFQCPGDHLRCNILLFFAPHIPRRVKRSTEAFVKKQSESDLDEIFGLNSILFIWLQIVFL